MTASVSAIGTVCLIHLIAALPLQATPVCDNVLQANHTNLMQGQSQAKSLREQNNKLKARVSALEVHRIELEVNSHPSPSTKSTEQKLQENTAQLVAKQSQSLIEIGRSYKLALGQGGDLINAPFGESRWVR